MRGFCVRVSAVIVWLLFCWVFFYLHLCFFCVLHHFFLFSLVSSELRNINEQSGFHVGRLRSAACEHTGVNIYSSDINIYSDINKSSKTETSKSTIRCRKTSTTFEYFHYLKQNTKDLTD